MKDLHSLFQKAEQEHIEIIPYPLPLTGSMFLETEEGKCYIGMDFDSLTDPRDRLVHLGHELGHCICGAFYNRYAKMDLRQKHENKADKWAIHEIIPEEALDNAVAMGCTQLWELAEHFCVPEDFMRKAVCLYTHGNLAAELYF